jgi:hypothetical protein
MLGIPAFLGIAVASVTLGVAPCTRQPHRGNHAGPSTANARNNHHFSISECLLVRHERTTV